MPTNVSTISFGVILFKLLEVKLPELQQKIKFLSWETNKAAIGHMRDGKAGFKSHRIQRQNPSLAFKIQGSRR